SPGALRFVSGSAPRVNRPLNPNCRGSCRSKVSTIMPVEPPHYPPPPTPPHHPPRRVGGGEWRASPSDAARRMKLEVERALGAEWTSRLGASARLLWRPRSPHP